jgi:taurine dioxygenase
MVMNIESQIARDSRIGSIDVISTRAALGAEVRGVDLKNLDETQFTALKRAWHEYQVILVRDQTLSDQDLIAFSRRFGDLDWAPVQETGRRFVEGLPEIYIVSNVTVNGQPIGSLGAGEAVWHTDMSYLDVPPMASMLYALEIPPSGGNTSFCSMYSIYEALPDELKRRIADLKIKHDGTYNSGGYLRQGVAATDDPRTSPGAVHPLVCTHPETGRRMLYLGRRRNAYLMGLELALSSPGSTSGGSAIWCCGITAVPCIGATRSTPRHAASCTERRSRAARRRSDDTQAQRLQYGSADHLPDVPDPLCGSGQHLDGQMTSDRNFRDVVLGLLFLSGLALVWSNLGLR